MKKPKQPKPGRKKPHVETKAELKAKQREAAQKAKAMAARRPRGVTMSASRGAVLAAFAAAALTRSR